MLLKNINESIPFTEIQKYPDLCTEIQSILYRLNLYSNAVDGIYGPKTENALVTFKRNSKLTGGNSIGPTTAKALLAAKPSELVTRKQAEYVYQTKLTDAEFADLNNCCRTFGITTKEDIREFLAQTGHESEGLRYMKEIGSYQYFNDNYEGREDLGNVYAGDGAKYPGVSPLQMTGRANYQAFANYIGDQRVMEGVDYVAEHYGFQPSGFWWVQNKVTEKIIKGATITQISALVNTGSINTNPSRVNGIADRLKYYVRAKEVI